MGMLLENQADGSTFEFATIEWHKLIELAQEYGWQPAGTQAAEEKNWSGSYWSNDGQVVEKDDATALSNALLDAGANIGSTVTKAKIVLVVIAQPPFSAAITTQINEIVAKQRTYWNNPALQVDVVSYDSSVEWLRRMIHDPEKRQDHVLYMHNYLLSPSEMFSGQQNRLLSFAVFCTKGAFEIH